MKCNNTHCKYYEPGYGPNWIEKRILGFSSEKDGGCKYPFCKKDRKMAGEKK